MSGRHVVTIPLEKKLQTAYKKHIFNLLTRFETELSKYCGEEYLKKLIELFQRIKISEENPSNLIKEFLCWKRKSRYLTNIKKLIEHELKEYERRNYSDDQSTTIFEDFRFYGSIYDRDYPKLNQSLDKLEAKIKRNKNLKNEFYNIKHKVVLSGLKEERHIKTWWNRWDEYLSFQLPDSPGFVSFQREKEVLERLYERVCSVQNGENFSLFIHEDFIRRCQEEYDFRSSTPPHLFFGNQEGVDIETTKREYLQEFKTFIFSMKVSSKKEDQKSLFKNKEEKYKEHTLAQTSNY